MMVSKRNFLFQGLISGSILNCRGISKLPSRFTRWPGEKRRSLRGIGSHEDDHAVEGGAWGEQVSQGMGIPKNSQGCQGNLQIINWWLKVGVWGRGSMIQSFRGYNCWRILRLKDLCRNLSDTKREFWAFFEALGVVELKSWLSESWGREWLWIE